MNENRIIFMNTGTEFGKMFKSFGREETNKEALDLQ